MATGFCITTDILIYYLPHSFFRCFKSYAQGVASRQILTRPTGSQSEQMITLKVSISTSDYDRPLKFGTGIYQDNRNLYMELYVFNVGT